LSNSENLGGLIEFKIEWVIADLNHLTRVLVEEMNSEESDKSLEPLDCVKEQRVDGG